MSKCGMKRGSDGDCRDRRVSGEWAHGSGGGVAHRSCAICSCGEGMEAGVRRGSLEHATVVDANLMRAE